MSETSEPVPEWAIHDSMDLLFEQEVGVDLARRVARALAATYARGREDAAKVCDERALSHAKYRYCDTKDGAAEQEAEECAAAIRSGGA